jgi:dolichyl-phosphate-mannose--protein O-mannosyl transferase
MFRYHSLVRETRWYASSWWQWPLMVRPVWLYTRQMDLPAGWAASIATFGNPAVWWPGAAAMLLLAATAVADLRLRRADAAGAIILLAFLGQYLPWVIAPRRLVFIYHFYTCVPFLILALAHLARRWAEASPPGLLSAMRFWPVVAAALFLLFYPLLAGVPVGPGWARLLRWLPTWIFYR